MISLCLDHWSLIQRQKCYRQGSTPQIPSYEKATVYALYRLSYLQCLTGIVWAKGMGRHTWFHSGMSSHAFGACDKIVVGWQVRLIHSAIFSSLNLNPLPGPLFVVFNNHSGWPVGGGHNSLLLSHRMNFEWKRWIFFYFSAEVNVTF